MAAIIIVTIAELAFSKLRSEVWNSLQCCQFWLFCSIEFDDQKVALFTKIFTFQVPSGSIQPEAWHDFSAQNKATAEMEMAKSQRLRENIFHSIEQTTNDLKVQTDATNFEFRKRIYEMARAKEELEYQMKKVRMPSKCQCCLLLRKFDKRKIGFKN